MTPLQLFLYILATALGFFAGGLLGIVLWVCWCAVRGYLMGEAGK